MQPGKGSNLEWASEHLLPWTLRFGRSLILVLSAFLVVLCIAIARGSLAVLWEYAWRHSITPTQQIVLRREIVPPLLFTGYALGLVLLWAVLDLLRFLRHPGQAGHICRRLRFEGFLLSKSAIALAVLDGCWLILRDPSLRVLRDSPSGEILVAWFWLFGLAAAGLLYWSLLDQRYRCRVCLRRLRMPVPTGSWSTPLLNRPGTEYICTFGHGKVNVAGVRLFGMEPARWTYNRDYWHELVEKEHAACEGIG